MNSNSTSFISSPFEPNIIVEDSKGHILLLFPKQYSSHLSIFLACIIIIIIVTKFLHAKTTKKNFKNLPPGPSFLTMIQNLVEFYNKPQQTLAKLAKLHAPDIMLLNLGFQSSTTIIISSPNIAKEVLQTNDLLFSDRMVPAIVTALDHHNFSLPFLPVCPLWKDLKKICNEQLFSTKVLDGSQGLRQKKLLDLLTDVRKYCRTGEAVDVGRAAFRACINFLSYTFVSEDFVESVENEKEEYKDMVSTLLKLSGTANVVDVFPVLKVLDPQGLQRNSAQYITMFFHRLDELIDKRLKVREEENYVTNNDMLDTLLDISHQDSQRMDREKIKHFLLDLLVAGTDTTAFGLERAMTELLHSPKAMSKAKQELEQIIGKGNPIKESDVSKLPYLQAIVKETLRLYPPAPLLLPRKAKIDVEVSGYTIPEGARVLINAWAMGRNPNIWEDAHLFLPERFLGSNIDVKGRDFQLTPFGSGRRICPGAPLAVRMMHVMLGSLINSFDWKLENNIKPEDMNMDQPLRAIPLEPNN